ncbi:hypothetical protein SOP94_17345 [Peribacillus frigoritolerans]|uniref:hypothetical protein n=1 Tax=Peribacillus frigoritolerans TaxID=450367 RepID=UPI002B24B34B|nr:hypothetical protein [Peribacillus frigoritolerans]MEB2630223.1 hypothetical protein [Peribacillus frigoritolerans]
MGFIYRYEFKNKSNREKVDLEDYKDMIVTAIEGAFDQNLDFVDVFSDFYEFRLKESLPTTSELQSLGKKIVRADPLLDSIKKVYKKNSQLFRRKRNSYYGFLEDIGYENGMYFLKFDLVDKEDSDRIQNGTEGTQLTKVDLLNKLNTFSMILEIGEQDPIAKKIRDFSGDEIEEIASRWYLLTGKHVKRGNSLLFLDYTERQDIASNFMLYSISELEETGIGWLESFFSLNEIDYQEDTDLEDNEEDFFIGVYNVGQGLCSAICNYKSQPMLYFDFGGGERKDTVTFPEDIKYCFSQKPKIILSHLHRDHWIGANRCEEALEMEWVVPPQKEKGAQVIKLFADISKKGKLTVLKSSTGVKKTSYGNLFICTGNNSHYHNNGIGFLVETKNSERYLMPGDNRYQHIPTQFLEDLNGIVASHHGGEYFQNKTGKSCIPQNSKQGEIVYSYGKHKKFDPKYNSHGHPSYVKEYIAKNWKTALHTPKGHCVLGPTKKANKCSCGCNLEFKW